MNRSALNISVGHGRTLGLMAALALWPCFLRAQDPATTSTPPAAPPSAPTPSAAPAAEKPPAVNAGGDKRLAEVLALKFDRSPATVLTAQAKLAGTTLAADAVELFRLRLIVGQWKAAAPFLATLPAEEERRPSNPS